MNTDKISTTLGAVAGGITAIQPVMNTLSGQVSGSDLLQLVLAFVLGALGYVTNKTAPTSSSSTTPYNGD